jgi:hypothetical protein
MRYLTAHVTPGSTSGGRFCMSRKNVGMPSLIKIKLYKNYIVLVSNPIEISSFKILKHAVLRLNF